jgi:hypothetical protein
MQCHCRAAGRDGRRTNAEIGSGHEVTIGKCMDPGQRSHARRFPAMIARPRTQASTDSRVFPAG